MICSKPSCFNIGIKYLEMYPFTVFAYQLLLIIGSLTNDKILYSFKEVLEKNHNELEIKIVPTVAVEIK